MQASKRLASSVLATTYVRVEKDGTKTYSDRPLPGGQPVELEPAHAEGLHDLVVAIAGIDHDRPGSAQDQKAKARHTAHAAAREQQRLAADDGPAARTFLDRRALLNAMELHHGSRFAVLAFDDHEDGHGPDRQLDGSSALEGSSLGAHGSPFRLDPFGIWSMGRPYGRLIRRSVPARTDQ